MEKKFGSRSKSALHDRIVLEIIVALSATGLCRVWSQPTGAAYREGMLIRYGLKGSADISGIMLGSGKRLEIEVKTGRAVQQTNQINFQRMIISFGGLYLVARSVEDALRFVKSMAADCKL